MIQAKTVSFKLLRMFAIATLCVVSASAQTSGAGAESGLAAYYGHRLEGHKTASGAIYRPNGMTAAHKTLPFGTKVKITNKKNGKTATAVINDRGPTTPGRILDVSRRVARQLGFGKTGMAEVELQVIQ